MRGETAPTQLGGVVVVAPVVAWLQEDGHRPRPGQRDARLVAVVHRLEDDHLVTGVEHPEERTGEGLRRPCRHEDLGVGIELEAVEAALVVGDSVAQHRVAERRWVLVDATADRRDGRVEHLRRPVGVGEALPEVDRAGGDRQRRHLPEDGGPEPLQLRRERRSGAGRGGRHAGHRTQDGSMRNFDVRPLSNGWCPSWSSLVFDAADPRFLTESRQRLGSARWWATPWTLAAYIARSAARSSDSSDVPCAGKSAAPTLAVSS